MANVATLYRKYTAGDKTAFNQLRAEAEEKIGAKIKLKDMISAVEPELETPEHLKNI